MVVHLCLPAYDAAFLSLITAILLLGFTSPAYAYVDPSVMTYTIQALAGVAVALSAVLGVAWRRIRKHLLRALRIDENEGKYIESEAHKLDANAPEYQKRLKQADKAAQNMKTKLNARKPERLCWGTRFLFALAATTMLFYTLVVAGPLEIVASSVNSLLFTAVDVWVPLAIVALTGALTCALILSLVRGRAFSVCFAIIASIGIAAYVQAMFFNTSLPAADGTQVAWADYTTITSVSAIAWIAILASAILLSIRKSLAFKGITAMLCLVGIIAQSVSLGILLTTPAGDGLTPIDERPSVTTQGISEVSDKNNIIMFVLDTFDTRYLQEAVQADPSCLDDFTGFTWFEDTTGSMIPTVYAMASMLTGQTPDESDKTFDTALLIDWYTQRGLIDDINAQGYETYLYATDIYDAIGALSEKVENIKQPEREIDYPSTVAMLVRCSLYRDAPWTLKPLFWFYTDQVNTAALGGDVENSEDSVWTMDDAKYYSILKNKGLVKTDIGENGSFRLIHLAGTHAPYTIDRNAEPAEGGTNYIEQSLGSLHIVQEYLTELKELGLYDNATIAVTADHGEWYLADNIYQPTSPMLLVKPATELGGSSEPIKTSSVPTGHIDLAATLLEAAGGNASAYEGMNIFKVPNADRSRYYYSTSVDGLSWTRIKQWEITGNALVWDNWRETGAEWPLE
ncbi:MAG: sulfatase-like hydrolase/transferase [Raoultibacter sp.]